MIIRYSKSEREEIQAVTQAYDEKIDALFQSLFDNVPGKDIEAIKESMRELNRARAEASLNKRYELENRRFLKIASSPKKILEDAKRQTNAIIAELLKLVARSKPLSNEERLQQLKELHGKSDAELLDMIEPIPDILVDIFSEIEATRGEAARLNADQITKIIKKDLRRHYNRLSETARKELDAFVEDAVSEALKEEPGLEVPIAYLRIYHDKFIDNFQLMNGNRIQEVQETENKKRLYIEVNGSIAEIKDWQDLNIQLGIPAHKLIMKALSLLTEDTSHYTVVFPTKDFFEEAGYKINNSTTFNTYVTRTNECISTLRHVAILENAGKNGGDWFIAGGKATTKWIRITFHPLYAETLIKNNMIMQFPKALLKMSGQKSNAYFLGCKMTLHFFNLNNVLHGNNTCLKVETLLDSAEFPFIEEIREQKASWIQKLRTPFETALDTLSKEGVISSWYYSKPKGKKLSPQERETARSAYDSWSRTLVHFKMKDPPDMSDKIEDYKKRKEARLARRKRKTVSKSK